MNKLPPIPVDTPLTSSVWNSIYERLRSLVNDELSSHNTLTGLQGGTSGQYYHLTNAEYTAISNSTSGTYTPTLTNTTNVAASTSYQAQYMRIGNTVTVSGRVDVDPTAAGQVVLGITIPITSNFGAVEDCAGVAFCTTVAGMGAALYADTTNDRASLEYIAVDLANRPLYFTFTYQVI